MRRQCSVSPSQPAGNRRNAKGFTQTLMGLRVKNETYERHWLHDFITFNLGREKDGE